MFLCGYRVPSLALGTYEKMLPHRPHGSGAGVLEGFADYVRGHYDQDLGAGVTPGVAVQHASEYGNLAQTGIAGGAFRHLVGDSPSTTRSCLASAESRRSRASRSAGPSPWSRR